MESNADAEIPKIDSNLKIHSFSMIIAERKVRFEVIKFKDSIFIWVGEKNNRSFTDLSLALMSRCATEPVCTKIMGSPTDLTSSNLAMKLSKKLGKPVYASFNLVEDRLTLAAVNDRINEEIKNNSQFF